ncbi:MAG: hypothetical protein Q9209_002774 [Squamulea sp. 1 TL-2023]
MNREPPISSITAGPPRATAASNIEDDDPSIITSTSSGTLTLTLRKTVTPSRSSLRSTSSLGPSSLSVNSSSANAPQTSDIPPATGHHSKLGAGLGGGLGGAAALLIGAAIFILCRRRQKPSTESDVKYHEMDAHDSTYQHNSMLFPAELTNEDSKTSMEPAELSPKTAPAFGPYELPGDDKAVGVPVASSNSVENTHQEKPKMGDTTTVSELSSLQDTEANVRRPLAPKRPDSHSGPWHDNF